MTCRIDEASFLVLNRKQSWERGLADNLDVSEQGLQLRARRAHALSKEIELARIKPGFRLQDFAADQCGLLYLLEAGGEGLWTYDHQQDRFERIDCLAPLFVKPVSLSFTPGTLFVADEEAESRVFALATFNWQARWVIGERKDGARQPLPLAQKFHPRDLANGRDDSLYALDAVNKAIFKFDRAGRLLEVFGHALLQGATPTALALGPDDTVYALDEGNLRVLRFRGTATSGSGVLIDFQELIDEGRLPATFKPHGLGVDASGDLYVGDRRDPLPGVEDDRFIRQFNADGDYLGEVTGFRGKVENLTLDRADRVYVFIQEPAEPTLQPQPRLILLDPEHRFASRGQTALVKGSYFSRAFDSAELGAIWHKSALEAALRENTQIRVSYLAADDKRFTIGGRTRDLDDFLAEQRDADETSKGAAIEALNLLGWSPLRINPREALFDKAEGRYLWLRIELIGSERQTPQLNSLRVDFPRRSYLRYLPAVYQEDERGRDFLERFLSLYESFFGRMEEQITRVVRYLDADAAVTRGEFLRWLASWFAIAVDSDWSDEQLRTLLKRAPALFKQRGTRAGLAAMIELFTGDAPLIVEHFQTQLCQSMARSGSLATAPLRCVGANLGGLLRIERIVPTYIRQGEIGEVKLELCALEPLARVQVRDTVSKNLELIRDGIRQPGKNFTLNLTNLTPAGGKIELKYEVAVSNSDGEISGQIEIWKPGDKRPRTFASPLSPVFVRASFPEVLKRLYGADPYCFCVLLKPDRALTDGARAAVRRIVEAEKPAHTCAGVKALQPLIQLDLHTFLEVNTYLSRPSLRLDLGAAIPQDTVLTDNEAAQLESHARLGVDTTLG